MMCISCLLGITEGPIILNGTNYRCYNTYSYFESHISSFFHIRLEHPYPANGVLLTFHSNSVSPHQRVASLYIKDSQLHFAVYNGTSVISLLRFRTLINSNYYNISILRNKIKVNITLVPSIEKTKSRFTDEFNEEPSEKVCLGRGTSELRPYKGKVDDVLKQGLQIYSEDFSLSASPLRYLPGNGSGYLSLFPNVLSVCETISFRVWMERPGSLIYMSKDGFMLNIELDEGSIIIDNGNIVHKCNASISKKTWLSFSLALMTASQLLVTVDHFECSIDDTKWAEALQAVESASVYIGKPVSSPSGSKIFRSYIEGLRIENDLMPPLCPVIHL